MNCFITYANAGYNIVHLKDVTWNLHDKHKWQKYTESAFLVCEILFQVLSCTFYLPSRSFLAYIPRLGNSCPSLPSILFYSGTSFQIRKTTEEYSENVFLHCVCNLKRTLYQDLCHYIKHSINCNQPIHTISGTRASSTHFQNRVPSKRSLAIINVILCFLLIFSCTIITPFDFISCYETLCISRRNLN